MNKIFIGALMTIVFGAGTATIVAASGLIDIGADVPHSPLIFKALEFGRERSIARRAAGLNVPEDLGSPERVRRGAGNYEAMCINCHLAPEMSNSEIRKGLYPRPPNLAAQAQMQEFPRSPARDFWIIKHGIKASGMPAWSKGGMDDEAIWDLAAFVQKLPRLAKADYDQLVAASDGHAHSGVDDHVDGHDEHESPPVVNVAPKPVGSPTAAHSHDDHEHGAHKH
jgi:cytochrome c553